ncbi:MAG: hypothetical protein AAFX81_00595 [Pseudomonadota bacterium]
MALTKWSAVIAVATLAACTNTQREIESASVERAVTSNAVVEAVDAQTRDVTLRTSDGRSITVEAGPEVRNFDQIDVGDTVQAVYVESVAARLAAPDDTAPTETTTVAGRAEPGEKPAAVAGVSIETIIDVLSYDPALNLLTFRTPEGVTHSLVVDPGMVDFASTLQRGDRVAITYNEAVAVGIEPTG